MSIKAKRLIGIYTVAALAALSVLSAVLYERLGDYKLAAGYVSSQSFETAVKAADNMSEALKKSLYATDGGMCGKVCSEVYANALAAESAMAALPFATYEMEHISGFINTAGDYAYSLCAGAAEDGFSEEQREELKKLSEKAEGFANQLRELQSSLNSGLAVMDETQERLQNIGAEETPKLSAELLDYESGFEELGAISYDGMYGFERTEEKGKLSESEMKKLAAKVAGVEERELTQEYDYEGGGARRCYSAGDMAICVSSRGLESMARSRLIVGGEVDERKAAQSAEKFLEKMGYEGLALCRVREGSGTLLLSYAPEQDGALCIDNTVTVAVAADDGSIHAFNAEKYSESEPEVAWNIGEDEAREKLPDGVEEREARKVIIKSAGQRDVPCYEFSCEAQSGEQVKIYVDADKGTQCRIEI